MGVIKNVINRIKKKKSLFEKTILYRLCWATIELIKIVMTSSIGVLTLGRYSVNNIFYLVNIFIGCTYLKAIRSKL